MCADSGENLVRVKGFLLVRSEKRLSLLDDGRKVGKVFRRNSKRSKGGSSFNLKTGSNDKGKGRSSFAREGRRVLQSKTFSKV